MNSSLQPYKVLILLAASCLVWVLAITTALVFFMDAGANKAWLLAGCLVFSALVWLFLMAKEVRQAIDLSDFPTAHDSLLAQCKLEPSSTLHSKVATKDAISLGYRTQSAGRTPARIRSTKRRAPSLPRSPAPGR